MERISGRVVWFNAVKGFGFLSAPGHLDVFCHYSAILVDGYKVLRDGEAVEFEIVTGEKGRPQAADVKILGLEPAGKSQSQSPQLARSQFLSTTEGD